VTNWQIRFANRGPQTNLRIDDRYEDEKRGQPFVIQQQGVTSSKVAVFALARQ
jgi:hypothetical protein